MFEVMSFAHVCDHKTVFVIHRYVWRSHDMVCDYDSALFGTTFGHHLNVCWACFGRQHLNKNRTLFGRELGIVWASAGLHLGMT